MVLKVHELDLIAIGSYSNSENSVPRFGQITIVMSEARIELVEKPEDLARGFDCVCEAFGRQTRDAIWRAMNPGWDTVDGRARGAARFVKRWRAATKDDQGQENTVFLKATMPETNNGSQERVVGIAIWVQLSMVGGHGDTPSNDLHKDLDLEELYPGDQSEQRYLCQALGSLHARRLEVVKEKASASPPSLMVLVSNFGCHLHLL